MVYKNKLKYLKYGFDIFLIIIISLFSYNIYKFLKKILPSFNKNFSSALILNIELTILIISLIYFGIYFIIIMVYNRFDKKPNWWIIYTIGLMIALLSIGCVFIDSELGKPDLSLLLRHAGDTNVIMGNITCMDNSGKLLEKSIIYCNINPKLENISGSVSLRLNNGSTINQEFSSQVSFVAVENVEYINFFIRGIENNETKGLVVGYPFTFLNEEENKNRQDKFIIYVLALLGIVLFSVPALMLNLKQLNKEGD